jgi:integrase
MGSKWPVGVLPREKSIEIRLNLNGKRQYVYINQLPSPANLKKAGALRRNAMEAIKWGQFSWREFFPDAKQAEQEKSPATFGQYAEIYLRTLTCADNTKEKYEQALNRYFIPELKDRMIASIKYSELLEIVSDYPWKTNKTRNNALIPLRGVFKLATKDSVMSSSPADEIGNGKHQNPEAEPLLVQEMELVLDWIAANRHETWHNYFEYALFSGLRPSEQIALQWDNVDFNRGYVRIEQTKIKGVLRNHTKTYKSRDVELNSRARAALTRQKKWTFLQGGEVFKNHNTGETFPTNKSARLIWNAALKACGIRHRKSYQTRHTFCTNNLEAGAKIHWVSGQMGHASTVMTLNRYSKWVKQANAENESSKLDAFIKGAQKVHREEENTIPL